MENEKVEFVKFGTRPKDTRTYALDSEGVVWVSNGNEERESLEVPLYIKQGLTAG